MKVVDMVGSGVETVGEFFANIVREAFVAEDFGTKLEKRALSALKGSTGVSSVKVRACKASRNCVAKRRLTKN